MALPKDAVVDVSLIDFSRADAPSVTLLQVRIRAGGKQVPIPFSLAYQPSKLRPEGIYQVRATISAGGRMIFTTDSAYPVITGGNPTSGVVLTLVRGRG